MQIFIISREVLNLFSHFSLTLRFSAFSYEYGRFAQNWLPKIFKLILYAQFDISPLGLFSKRSSSVNLFILHARSYDILGLPILYVQEKVTSFL